MAKQMAAAIVAIGKIGSVFPYFLISASDKAEQPGQARPIAFLRKHARFKRCSIPFGGVFNDMSLRNANARRKFLTSLVLQQQHPAGSQAMTFDPARLDERVKSALAAQAGALQRNLRFEASEGRVTLHGTVHSYYQKQMAQEALRRLEGVQTIDNQIEVSWT